MDSKKSFNTVARCIPARLRTAWQWAAQGPPQPVSPLIYSVYSPDSEKPLPKNWEYMQHNFAGIPVGCARLHAKNKDEPVAKITLFTGLKSSPDQYNTPVVRMMQKLGFEIDIIPLPDPRNQIGYGEDYRRIVDEALISNPLPSNHSRKTVPHIISAHSSGATAIAANALNDDFMNHLRSNYAGVMLMGAHFSSPARQNPLLKGVYATYCCLFNDKAFGKAPLDFMYNIHKKAGKTLRKVRELSMKYNARILHPHEPRPQDRYQISKSDEKLSKILITPDNTEITHGQIYHSILYGESVLKNLLFGYTAPQNKDERLTTYFIGGTRDFVSCGKSIEKAAEILKAKVFTFDAEHQPLLESKEAVRFIINALESMIDDWHFKQARNTKILIPVNNSGDRSMTTWGMNEDPMSLYK